MALCHNCTEVRDEYVGNGVQEYEITFEYYDQDDVAVAFGMKLWLGKVPNTDWVFQHETLLDLKAPENSQVYYLSLY